MHIPCDFCGPVQTYTYLPLSSPLFPLSFHFHPSRSLHSVHVLINPGGLRSAVNSPIGFGLIKFWCILRSKNAQNLIFEKNGKAKQHRKIYYGFYSKIFHKGVLSLALPRRGWLPPPPRLFTIFLRIFFSFSDALL